MGGIGKLYIGIYVINIIMDNTNEYEVFGIFFGFFFFFFWVGERIVQYIHTTVHLRSTSYLNLKEGVKRVGTLWGMGYWGGWGNVFRSMYRVRGSTEVQRGRMEYGGWVLKVGLFNVWLEWQTTKRSDLA